MARRGRLMPGGTIEITRVEPLMSVGKVTRREADPAVGDRVEPE